VQLTYTEGRFIAKCAFEHKDIVKGAGFRWNATERVWYTENFDNASKIAAIVGVEVSDELRAELAERARVAAENMKASRAVDAVGIDLPVPDGLAYRPFQKAGIAYGASKPGVLIADEMGLGKTVQAIGIANLMGTAAKPVLIVCPASLKLNWQREWARWSTTKMSVAVVSGKSGDLPKADVVIINYDLITARQEQLSAVKWGLLIADEAHYAKNPGAKRTKALFGANFKGGISAVKRVFLTGTPMPNRPFEMWPLVAALDPTGLGAHEYKFKMRYCAPEKIHVPGRGYVTQFKGASNLEELQAKLRSSIMVRRLKSEVLTELPPKTRQIVPFAIDSAGTAKLVEGELKAFAKYEALERAIEDAKAQGFADKVAKLNDQLNVAFAEMSDCRVQVALAKLPQVVEALEDAIESGKVICFAHHQVVVQKIMAHFGERAVKVDGSMKMAERQASVDRFQKDDSVRLFVGSIYAASEGLTLTASSHVVFAELDWVPAKMSQAEDRAHRIGQIDNVLVQHLVLDNSLDARMAKTLIEKQEVIDRALDREIPVKEQTQAVPKVLPPVVKREEKKPVDTKISRDFPAARIAAIHEGLKILAGLDFDRATELNGVGFNKLDNQIGHSLAKAIELSPRQAALGYRIVCKYHRQLGAELMGRIKVTETEAA
jgi:SWI/SNF-related matrix-associated actin-dependent regulator 1 of chromatin subfamily A